MSVHRKRLFFKGINVVVVFPSISCRPGEIICADRGNGRGQHFGMHKMCCFLSPHSFHFDEILSSFSRSFGKKTLQAFREPKRMHESENQVDGESKRGFISRKENPGENSENLEADTSNSSRFMNGLDKILLMPCTKKSL